LDVLKRMSRVRRIGTDLVFSRVGGKKLAPSTLRGHFNNAQEKAKIDPHCRIHDLRHTHGAWNVQGGNDLYETGKLLGHKDLKMTQRYAHHNVDSLRRAVEVVSFKG